MGLPIDGLSSINQFDTERLEIVKYQAIECCFLR